MTDKLADLYPPTPDGVPADLTTPSAAYTRNARLALAGLLAFVGLYLWLTWFFANATWRLVHNAMVAGDGGFIGYLLALGPAFLTLFMVRGFFFTKHAGESTDIEISEADEPLLVAFVHRIAEEAGAPRPHRIFLSANVNAAVFYDLSFRNLLLPTKKNLVLGLGLVNALSVDELKAVVAHEFGHFAQKTMAVGRYVYVAHQIVGHVVASRGWLDSVLAGISVIDIRVAWIGWIMRLLVWSIRSILDTAFRILLLAHRALSREMEFQADLVSVSLAGSDSLVHGLSRLSAADGAFDRAANFTMGRLNEDKRVADLFALQTEMLETVRRILDEPEHGNPPPVPTDGAAAHRVFEDEIAAPPRMWSTHPPNRDREENAKARYVPSPLDPRSAWQLFADPAALRGQMTRNLIDRVTSEAPADALAKLEDEPIDESLAALRKNFEQRSLDRTYRGVYLGRSVVIDMEKHGALFDDDAPGDAAALRSLYPESLNDDLGKHKELASEVALLTALKEGVLEAPGGIIRFRGEEIPRSELAEVIDGAKSEEKSVKEVLLAHDRKVRSTHRAAARDLGPGWEAYHVGLVQLLHYAEHASAELSDALGHLRNVFSVVIADGNVSRKERKRLLFACEEVQQALGDVWDQRNDVVVPASVAEAMEAESWIDALPDAFHLVPPTDDMLGDWLDAVESWARAFGGPLGGLAHETLEELLATEERIRGAVLDGEDLGEAPTAAAVPARYRTCCPHQERELQKKLGLWDRFILAEGAGPATLRTMVALSVLAPAMFLTGSAGNTDVTVYNGLASDVHVTIGDASVRLAAGTYDELTVPAADGVTVLTRTDDGDIIETFAADASSSFGQYVYNVAAAVPMVEWTQVYGSATERPPRMLGAPRFFSTRADAIFREPPEQISTSGSGGTRDVLEAIDAHPAIQMQTVEAVEDRVALLMAHLRHDPLNAPDTMNWFYMAHDQMPERTKELVKERLAAEGPHVVLLRAEQDLFEDDACARHTKQSEANPDDPDLLYARLRCAPDSPENNAAFRAGSSAHPDHAWLRWGAAYGLGLEGRWEDALPMAERALEELPPISDQIAQLIAQARRMVQGPQASISDLADVSINVSQALDIAGPSPEGGDGLTPWRAVEAGEYAAAWAATQEMERERGATIAWLIATSAGASADERARALGLPDGLGLDGATVWAAAALAAREGKDLTPFRGAALVHAPPEVVEALFPLLEGDRIATEPDAIDAALPLIHPRWRGHAYVMGTVLHGADAPEVWRDRAEALVLAGNRPRVRAAR